MLQRKNDDAMTETHTRSSHGNRGKGELTTLERTASFVRARPVDYTIYSYDACATMTPTGRPVGRTEETYNPEFAPGIITVSARRRRS